MPTVATIPAPDLSAIRVAGLLAEDAQLGLTTGQPPRMLLQLHLQPDRGLPYVARVDLGEDAADHMAAEALLPQLRRGAAVSVACAALELRTDHGHAALRLVRPHAVMLFTDPHPAAAA